MIKFAATNIHNSIDMIPKNEYAPYFEQYIQLVSKDEKSIIENLEDSQKEFKFLLRNLPEEKHLFTYEEGKWTVKQLLRHIIDTERMFAFRAMSIARNEQAMLPGFDDQSYVESADDSQNSFGEMLTEFDALRESNICMIQSFTSQALERIGNANGSSISVRAIIFIIAGHLAHHKNIISRRYLEHV